MRIVCIIASCSSGGAEIFVKNLLKSIKAQDYSIYVELWVMCKAKLAYPEDTAREIFESTFIKDLNKFNIPIRFINKRPHKDWLIATKKIRELFCLVNPDIIHTHLESVTFHVVRALKNTNIPIIQTIHSSKIRYPYIERYYIQRHLSCNISISTKVANILNETCKVPPEKNHVIFSGINLNDFYIPDRKIRRNVLKIIAVGRLTAAKDYPTLLSAYKILVYNLLKKNEKIPTLQIIGDGELRTEVCNLIKNFGLSDYITMEGLRNDISDLLKKADIYVMASAWEGLSISLIEASASGIPIIATDVGSNNEIIDDNINGILVPSKHPIEMAEGLYKLIKNLKLREYLSKNCFSKARAFSIRQCAKKHLELYKELVRK